MARNDEDVEVTINLIDVLKAFLHRWWLIALSAVLFAGLAFGYTYMFTEQYYQAEVRLYVNAKADVTLGNYALSLSDLNASRSLVSTYAVIAKRKDTVRSVVDEAVIYNSDGTTQTMKEKYEKMGVDVNELYSYNKLNPNISISAVNSTEVLSLKVKALDPEDAMAIANAFTEIFPKDVSNIIIGTEARPVDYADTATPIGRGFVRMTVIGFAAGVAIALAGIFVVDILINDTIESEDWIHETFGEGVPVLTVIPEDDDGKGYGKYKRYGYYKYSYQYGYGYGYGSRTHSKEKKNEEDKIDG